MAYDLYASPVPVPEQQWGTTSALHFATKGEALERAHALRRAGWFIYRISGSDGWEMTESQIARYCDEQSDFAKLKKGTFGRS